jgi:hypothetical protein
LGVDDDPAHMRLGEGSDRRETVRRRAASALVVVGAILFALDGQRSVIP